MPRTDSNVPFSAFEHDSQAVIAAADDGTIQFCNRAACRLLGVEPETVESRRCWALAAFRGPEGSAFCGSECPVRRAAHERRFGVRHRVLAERGPWAGQPLELISFFVPSPGCDLCGVVHFLRPFDTVSVRNGEAGRRELGAVAPNALTAREREVLRLLADGHSTGAVAGELGICATTVRNHVGHILHKLGVHRRIEAIVASRRAAAPRAATTDARPDATGDPDGGATPSRRPPREADQNGPQE